MNPKQTLVIVGTAVLCGIALAQNPPSPADRLDSLEKEVAALRSQLGGGKAPTADEIAALRKELADTRAQTAQLVQWAAAQAQGAADLSAVLDDAEAKGFTYGINPDSRVALLSGWRNFAASLQKDAPKPPAEPVKPTARSGR